jgi:hypothetical protein
MYDAKAQEVGQVSPLRVRVVGGVLEEISEEEYE